MKNIKIIFSFFLLISVVIGCETEEHVPLDESGSAPGPVTNVAVENISGGAVISYTLPNDPNLLYVKAVYERNGKEVETKASYFTNNLIVEGMGNTEEKEITLYAVSRTEQESEPVMVRISPLTPPIEDVMASLEILESFGGMNVWFENPASSTTRPVNIVIEVLMWDQDANEWVNVDAYYTGLRGGSFSVRGLEAVERTFGFAVRDTWGNVTDTLEKVMTPVYEEEIDGSQISDARGDYPVPQMAPFPASGEPIQEPGNLGSWRFERLFDGSIGNTGFHTTERQDVPIWIPMDLGNKVRLSRYKIWQRMHDNNSTYFYSHGNPHEWEIWGTNTPQDPESWVLLDHQIMVKPSGLPLGQLTNDDVEAARAGHEYEFPIDVPAVRYIAWKHIDSWAAIDGATGFLHMGEMRIWGQIQD